MTGKEDSKLIQRINEMEKSLEALEQQSGLLSEEIRSFKDNLEALRNEAGLKQTDAGLRSEAAADPSKPAAAEQRDRRTAASIESPVVVSEIEIPAAYESPSGSFTRPAVMRPKAQGQEAASQVTNRQEPYRQEPKRRRTRASKAAKQGEVNLERFIGRNAMGIGASILVFIAMVMFATLLMPYIGKELKLAAMYLFSFILIGIGEWIYRKQKNGYLVLSACGAGALYISIVATRMLFHFIGNTALYILLLLWIGYISYLGRKRSLIFVIIGQIGILISLVIAAIGMFSPADMYLSFAFLMAAEVLFFVLFLKADYRFALTNSIGLFLSLFSFDSAVYERVLRLRYDSFPPGAALLLISIVLAALAALRLLQVSGDDGKLTASGIISIVNGIMVAGVCLMLEYAMTRSGAMSMSESGPILKEAAWCFVPLTVYLLAILLALLKKQKADIGTKSPVLYICFAFLMGSVMLWPSRVVPFVIAAILLAIVAYNYKADRRDMYYVSQAVVLLGIEQTVIRQSLLTGLLMMALSVAQMVYYRRKTPHRREMLYEIFSYLTAIAFTIVLIDIISFRVWTGSDFMKYLATVAMFIVIQILARETDWMDCDANTLNAFHFANLAMMAFALKGFYGEFRILELVIYSLAVAGLFSINLRQLIEIKEVFGAYIAAKYTVLLGVIMHSLNALSYVYSIVFLVVAIASVVSGFKIRNKSIRMYGLVLSMLSIAKLILIDISYTNTLARAVSFLVCGLLCFGISLVYNYIDKQQKLKEGPSPAEGPAENNDHTSDKR